MNSHITGSFRRLFDRLPQEIKRDAKDAYRMWKRDPYHTGLNFKKIEGTESVYSARIGLHWRAVADKDGQNVTWFWIGSHADYDALIKSLR